MDTTLSSYATAEQLAEIHTGVHVDDDGIGSRVISVQVLDGWAFRVLLDRGSDIGSAWYGGRPIAWTSPIGERRPLDRPQGFDWLNAFGGGLITTCGLRNVGLPSEENGLHGQFSHCRARVLEVDRGRDEFGASVIIKTVVEELLPPNGHFRLERTLTTHQGIGRLSLVDVTTNLGSEGEPAPLLYHVNLGYPLMQLGTTISWPSLYATPRDDDARGPIELVSAAGVANNNEPEAVFEHVVKPDSDGTATVVVTSPQSRMRFELAWSIDELPRLHQWVKRSRGWYVVGVEPSNCSVMGRAQDRAEGRLPWLRPGASRTTKLVFDITAI